MARIGHKNNGLWQRSARQREIPLHTRAILRPALQLGPSFNAQRHTRPHQRHPNDPLDISLLQHVRTHDFALPKSDQSNDNRM